ncbi:chaperone protein EcpD [Pseudomonas sp. 2725]|jgi:chaperone protein EcpD|uniref:fimbrial biogenesis chaperone n=1 Tax=Pseudomonas sp. 2725 TaxID=3156449 RepID=UPI003D2626DF
MFGLTRHTALYRQTVGACMSLLLLMVHAPVTQAALTLGATRVVFDSNKRSTSVIVANPSNRPFAVQTWVNTVADDDVTPVPFIPSPSLFRLNPGKEQQLQINGLPNTLPDDRESLFFLNVQEIPQAETSDGNALNIALRTRIKLFYRPAQIKDNPMARLKDLQWSLKDVAGERRLIVNNPTPFHVSFVRLEVLGDIKNQIVPNAVMVEPFSSQTYALNGIKLQERAQILFSAINDYGGYSEPLTVPIQLAP